MSKRHPIGERLKVTDIAAPEKNSVAGGPFGSDLVSDDYTTDGVPVIRGTNLNGRYLTGPFVFVSPAKAESLSRNIATPGDLVFTQRGTLGQVSLVPNAPYERYVISQSQMKLTPDPSRVDVNFLFYWFTSPRIQSYIIASAIQTGVPHTNLGILRDYPVELPPLPEQQKIAAILSTWDRAIELTEKLIAAKQKRKQALMQQLLTGKVQLPGFSDEWTEDKAGKFFKKRSEPGIADLPTLSVTMDQGLIRRDEIERKMETTLEPEQHLLVRKGDIAYNMMRMWQGASGLATEDGIVSPAYVVLKPTKHVDSLFASYLFKLRHTVKQFEDYSFGLTSDRLRLYYKDFAIIPLRFPSVPEQQRIAAILTTQDREIEVLGRMASRLAEQKKGLMQQLLTGKVRVNLDAETVRG